MGQLNLYLNDELKDKLERQAKQRGISLSRLVGEILQREVSPQGWPEGYFDQVLGNWQGVLERPDQGLEEVREDL